MSGDGKRSVAEWPKLPRPSSTLPKRRLRKVPNLVAFGAKRTNISVALTTSVANDPKQKLNAAEPSVQTINARPIEIRLLGLIENAAE